MIYLLRDTDGTFKISSSQHSLEILGERPGDNAEEFYKAMLTFPIDFSDEFQVSYLFRELRTVNLDNLPRVMDSIVIPEAKNLGITTMEIGVVKCREEICRKHCLFLCDIFTVYAFDKSLLWMAI